MSNPCFYKLLYSASTRFCRFRFFPREHGLVCHAQLCITDLSYAICKHIQTVITDINPILSVSLHTNETDCRPTEISWVASKIECQPTLISPQEISSVNILKRKYFGLLQFACDVNILKLLYPITDTKPLTAQTTRFSRTTLICSRRAGDESRRLLVIGIHQKRVAVEYNSLYLKSVRQIGSIYVECTSYK